MLYVVQIVYLVAIAFIKFSILLFFRRIFSIPQIKIPLLVIASTVASWLVATVIIPQSISLERALSFSLGFSRSVFLLANPWILGQGSAFDVCQHNQLFPRGGYT